MPWPRPGRHGEGASLGELLPAAAVERVLGHGVEPLVGHEDMRVGGVGEDSRGDWRCRRRDCGRRPRPRARRPRPRGAPRPCPRRSWPPGRACLSGRSTLVGAGPSPGVPAAQEGERAVPASMWNEATAPFPPPASLTAKRVWCAGSTARKLGFVPAATGEPTGVSAPDARSRRKTRISRSRIRPRTRRAGPGTGPRRHGRRSGAPPVPPEPPPLEVAVAPVALDATLEVTVFLPAHETGASAASAREPGPNPSASRACTLAKHRRARKRGGRPGATGGPRRDRDVRSAPRDAAGALV